MTAAEFHAAVSGRSGTGGVFAYEAHPVKGRTHGLGHRSRPVVDDDYLEWNSVDALRIKRPQALGQLFRLIEMRNDYANRGRRAGRGRRFDRTSPQLHNYAPIICLVPSLRQLPKLCSGSSISVLVVVLNCSPSVILATSASRARR